MRHNLLNDTYRFISELIYSKLMCIKRTGLFYCRGAPPDQLSVKKENIISIFVTAVVCKSYCGPFLLKICNKSSQNHRACKQMG